MAGILAPFFLVRSLFCKQNDRPLTCGFVFDRLCLALFFDTLKTRDVHFMMQFYSALALVSI